jgi:hypothetical protein
MDKTKTKAEPDIPATMIESGIADATEEFLNTICSLQVSASHQTPIHVRER